VTADYKHTIVLDTRGPQTREEFWDAVKAYSILRGGSAPSSMEVPMATYVTWTQWSANEKGSADQDAPPTMAALPETFGGLNLTIGPKFRMY